MCRDGEGAGTVRRGAVRARVNDRERRYGRRYESSENNEDISSMREETKNMIEDRVKKKKREDIRDTRRDAQERRED